jgi:hypothetical protein
MAAGPVVNSCGGGEGGKPTLRAVVASGLVGEPVAITGGGMRSLRCARLQPDWGKPNVRLIGGREETGASRLRRAARGASCLPDPDPPMLPHSGATMPEIDGAQQAPTDK